jgi:hypothetical protein
MGGAEHGAETSPPNGQRPRWGGTGGVVGKGTYMGASSMGGGHQGGEWNLQIARAVVLTGYLQLVPWC